MPPILEHGGWALTSYIVLGGIVGLLSIGVTKAVYSIEDAFEKLPIHWMWWPALGGLVAGLVGWFEPRTMGVGYENIDAIVSGNFTVQIIAKMCILTFITWAVALGSGTSGATHVPIVITVVSFPP